MISPKTQPGERPNCSGRLNLDTLAPVRPDIWTMT